MTLFSFKKKIYLPFHWIIGIWFQTHITGNHYSWKEDSQTSFNGWALQCRQRRVMWLIQYCSSCCCILMVWQCFDHVTRSSFLLRFFLAACLYRSALRDVRCGFFFSGGLNIVLEMFLFSATGSLTFLQIRVQDLTVEICQTCGKHGLSVTEGATLLLL